MSQISPSSQTVVAMKQIGVNMLQTDFEEKSSNYAAKKLKMYLHNFFGACVFIYVPTCDIHVFFVLQESP